MAEREIDVKLPNGMPGKAVEVPVEESTEKWSEFTLQDGTIIRVKASLISALRVIGEYDPQGNPLYLANLTNIVGVLGAPSTLREGTPTQKQPKKAKKSK